MTKLIFINLRENDEQVLELGSNSPVLQCSVDTVLSWSQMIYSGVRGLLGYGLAPSGSPTQLGWDCSQSIQPPPIHCLCKYSPGITTKMQCKKII